MANFDAMVPLIPKDTRIPVDHNREQMRVNQVERLQEIKKISDEETNTINDNDKQREGRQQPPAQQSAPEQQPPADTAEQPSSTDGVDDDGHIDTYA